ncbi:hypothetical protein HNO88_004234, partial [Novosphingobium chloroacetimidivorans]|nr:hypothetical protein [Novosphingobium chloroacetimidivorans]
NGSMLKGRIRFRRLLRSSDTNRLPTGRAIRFARRTVLAYADASGVDHHDLAFESGANSRQKPVPHPGFAPADELVVTGSRGAVTLGHLGPWRTGPKTPENAVQNPTIIYTGNPARLVRQQRLNDRPFLVCQFVSPPRHPASIAMEGLNHASRQTSSQFISLPPKHLGFRRRGNGGRGHRRDLSVVPAGSPPGVWCSLGVR